MVYIHSAAHTKYRLGCLAAENVALELIEGKVLGGGAFSRVSKVMSTANQREYALKRMRKSTVLQCPEHVFCEQHITRNTAHPFCIRQVRPQPLRNHLLMHHTHAEPFSNLVAATHAEVGQLLLRIS